MTNLELYLIGTIIILWILAGWFIRASYVVFIGKKIIRFEPMNKTHVAVIYIFWPLAVIMTMFSRK